MLGLNRNPPDLSVGRVNTIQDRNSNFRDENGKLFLVRCFNCDPEYGRENYVPAVASGQCAWCGWKEEDEEIK